ncbi:MAG: ribonuclease H-like domain-containing protein [Nannocystaceae bacterium]
MDQHDVTHVAELAVLEPGIGMHTAFAVVRHLRRGQTRAGKPFWEIRLSDRGRTVAGKIWSDASRAMTAAEELEVGAHVKALFEIDEYKGALQLSVRGLRRASPGEPGYDPALLADEGAALVADLVCDVLVFDIETVPAVDLRKAPPTIAQAVAKHAERNEWDQAKVMSLSPYFGQVVSLAVGNGEQDPRTQDVTVFVVPPAGASAQAQASLPHWIRPVSEVELLQAFWSLAGSANVVVSYNGRGFDVPFLIGRSLIHGVPVRTDLLGNKYALRPHLDLFAVLGSGSGGSRGPASLDVVCWALGLASPKESMDGSMVAGAYAKGDLNQIALYNAGDVRATTGVFQRVRDQLLRYREDW